VHSSLQHLLQNFQDDLGEYAVTGEITDALLEALYGYYSASGEMPYGVMKARDGDPHEWISERFWQDYGRLV
jgi:hypothetical protein